MNKRKDKIDLLKGLLKGSKSLSELYHPPVTISIGTDQTTFQNKITGKNLTEDEVQRFHEYLSKCEKVKFKVKLIKN